MWFAEGDMFYGSDLLVKTKHDSSVNNIRSKNPASRVGNPLSTYEFTERIQ
ncbi:hypothetical protein MUP77_07940 [Candidatus Bathyarchaeota archaeon]|nr:hypothetical protein [Candidatus Bathyarchaeota archaeon]